MRRGRACVRTARGVVPIPMIMALLLVVGVMDAEILALAAGAKSGPDAEAKAPRIAVLLDLEAYPALPAKYCISKGSTNFWSSPPQQPSARVSIADDAPRTYHQGGLVLVCRVNKVLRLRIENTEYLSTDSRLQLALGNASDFSVAGNAGTSRPVMNSSHLLELSTGRGAMECIRKKVKTPNDRKAPRVKYVYSCCAPTGWAGLEAHSVTTIIVDLVLPPPTGSCTVRTDRGTMKHNSPDTKRNKLAIALSIAGAALISLVVAFVCLHRRFKKRHVQLQDTQERLIDNVQELGHAVNPRPSTTANQGRFGDKKRPRFGSQFFSKTPDNNQVSATSPTVVILTPSDRPSRTPGSENGFAVGQLPDAKSTADDEKQASTAPTPSAPRYSAYVSPTIASAESAKMAGTLPHTSGCRVGSNSGDTLGPLVRAAQRCVADGNRKSASADHATKSRPDIIQGSQQSFAVQSSSSERAPTLRSGLHRSESDRQDAIYDHVLGGQRQSNAALRRSHLILM